MALTGAPHPALSLRILLSPDAMIGPGKAQLLQAIRDCGSIAAGARSMGMSYKRAWQLIGTMNAHFRDPLVAASKGGKAGGGAQLTGAGLAVLASYQRIAAICAQAAAADLALLDAMATSKAAP